MQNGDQSKTVGRGGLLRRWNLSRDWNQVRGGGKDWVIYSLWAGGEGEPGGVVLGAWDLPGREEGMQGTGVFGAE